jgi:acetyltransferase-like isoleucine patch superfamily enzyme
MIKFFGALFIRVYFFFSKGKFYSFLINNLVFFQAIIETRKNETPIFFRQYLKFKCLYPKVIGPYWPIHSNSTFTGDWRNVYVGIDSSPSISPGCYTQALGEIIIGNYTQIAPNVGLISSNHFMLDIRKHVKSRIQIGEYCRIGMGSIILPNVVLGDFVTVSAGSVVTSSFPDGYCVIGGNPARMITDYSKNESIKNKFLRYKNEFEYNGMIPASEFEDFRKKHLNV